MKIEYFEITNCGNIIKLDIDTSDKNYISHSDSSVIFTKWYHDEYDDSAFDVVTRTRIFEEIKAARAKKLKEVIADFQKDLNAVENATSYDHYRHIVYPR